MITLEHIEIYKKYGGNGDGFIRCATLEEKSIMSYHDWSLIDDIVQDLIIIKKGFASVSFIGLVDERLKKNCDNEEVIQVLMNMINQI